MAERLAYRGLFRGGEPVRAADVAAGPPGRAGAAERAASLAADAALGMARPRRRGAEPLWSLVQRLEFAFCLAPLWDLSEEIEADIAAPAEGRAPGPGRKRHWPIMCALALEVALWDSGSMRAAVREISDPATWMRLRRATRRA